MVLKKIKVVNEEEFNKRISLFSSLGKIYNILFSPEFSIGEADGLILFDQDKLQKNYKKQFYLIQQKQLCLGKR